MYERDLQDLIRGLRSDAAKRNEPKFIAEVIDEIRQEIVSEDMQVKAGAVCKLTYLDMLGYDMTWASFHIVEVMSSPYHHIKAVGYLAAANSFNQDTDVLMLTTNLLKKEFSSGNVPDISASLNSLSHIVTPSLARDLTQDLIPMLTHSRPLIRKRAVLVLYKMALKYPGALDQGFNRLREKLEDPDIGVVSATVNVLCELARKDPERFLPLAPQLFHLLTNSSNNWMLIKIVKLFGAMTPCEPRLIKKLQPPLTELISTTPAVSLLYECVRTCIIGGMFHAPQGRSLAKMCVDKLAAFLDDPDQNLKYIALLALVKIVPSHPHLVAEHQESILSSVTDDDVSIRMRALDLISAMVNRHSLQPILQHLLSHLSPSGGQNFPSASQSLHHITAGIAGPAPVPPTLSPSYRLEVSNRILTMCSHDTYDSVEDFEWYISVLVDLTYVARANVGEEIKKQLVDICVRVRSARRFAVGLMRRLVEDTSLLQSAIDKEDGCCSEVLWAAAWICGEYSADLTNLYPLLPFLLSPLISDLPVEIVKVYIQSATKVLGCWMAELAERWDDRGDDAEYQRHHLTAVRKDVDGIIDMAMKWIADPDVEVQERATTLMNLLKFLKADLTNHKIPSIPASRPLSPRAFTLPDRNSRPNTPLEAGQPTYPKSLLLISPLSSAYDLNYVAESAQASVRLPDGIDLDMWIVDEKMAYGGVDDEDGSRRKSAKKGKAKKKDAGDELNGLGSRKKKKRRNEDLGEEMFDEDLPGAMNAVSDSLDEETREQRRLDRLERYRDDPYYIMDPSPAGSSKAKSKPTYDVDSIPVVRLEGLSLGPPTLQHSSSHLAKSRPFSSVPTSRSHTPRVEIDKGGEMPIDRRGELHPASPSTSLHAPSSSLPGESTAMSEAISSQPIKVVRAKKNPKPKKKATVAI